MSMFLKERFSYKFPNTINEIDSFTGKDFERFLFEYFKLDGYSPILTDDSGDRGIDLLVTIKNEDGSKSKLGIQAKRWKQPVGSNEISQILQGKTYYDCDELWIITTSSLTAQAQNTSLNNNITILTRVNVIEMLEEIKANPIAKFTESKVIAKVIAKPSTSPKVEVKKKEVVTTGTKYEGKNSELFDSLSELRRRIAKEDKLSKVYFVFNNATIESIIETMPYNEKGLSMITGLGEKKIEKYGDRILAIVKEHNGIKEKKRFFKK